MDTRFIADPHLFDIDSKDWRKELNMSLEDYAEFFVDKWNFHTSTEDLVLLAGDIGVYCERTIRTLERLNGDIVLVLGNHDVSWGNNVYIKRFRHVCTEAELGKLIYVKHIPEFTDQQIAQYSYLIHGHHHRYDMPNMYRKLEQYAKNSKQLNCGADLNYHHPCTLPELITNKEQLLYKYMERGLL